MGEIWVFSQDKDTRAELLAGAAALGSKAAALVLGPRSEAEAALHQGADEALWLGEMVESATPEDYVDTIWSVLSERKPSGLFFSATMRCKVIAGRLAARLETSVMTDIAGLELLDGKLTASRRMYGGVAIRTERAAASTTIVTVGQGAFQARPADETRTGEIIEVPFVDPDWKLVVKEQRPKDEVSVNLAAADCVVGVGRGIKQQDDLAMIGELAALLGAAVGCSRPLAEAENWFPHSQYIGVTGAMIKPDIYLAIGLSGQVQHMVGVEGAKVIVAINEDQRAPVFAAADYGIVGDLYEAVPALIDALKNR